MEEQKRKQEEELRIQEAKRKEEMARWKMEEEQRRAAEEAKVRFHYFVKCYWYFFEAVIDIYFRLLNWLLRRLLRNNILRPIAMR